MITLHGDEVRVGDKVWHMSFGWGEVTELDSSDYPICVQFEGFKLDWFTEDGKIYAEDNIPILFWEPTELEIPKKPKKEKAWQWICKTGVLGNRYFLTSDCFASKEEALEKLYVSVPVEPYLPSEIEREVKE